MHHGPSNATSMLVWSVHLLDPVSLVLWKAPAMVVYSFPIQRSVSQDTAQNPKNCCRVHGESWGGRRWEVFICLRSWCFTNEIPDLKGSLLPILRTALDPKTLKRSTTPMLMPPSVKTPHSSPPTNRQIGNQRVLNTKLRDSPKPSVKPTLPLKSRSSRWVAA